jgi:AcrR family transcriptional regulator
MASFSTERTFGRIMSAQQMNGGKSKSTVGAGDTSRQRLLDAGIEVFARGGFAGSSVRDLAREAGLSLAGLYHHFSSKDEILFEIQRQSYQQLLEPLSVMTEDEPPDERLSAFVYNHIDFFSRQQTKMRLLSHELGALTGPYGDEINDLRNRYFQICFAAVRDLLVDLKRDNVNAQVATMSLFGMINWIYRWYPQSTDPPPDELAKQMLHLFLYGVHGGRDSCS